MLLFAGRDNPRQEVEQEDLVGLPVVELGLPHAELGLEVHLDLPFALDQPSLLEHFLDHQVWLLPRLEGFQFFFLVLRLPALLEELRPDEAVHHGAQFLELGLVGGQFFQLGVEVDLVVGYLNFLGALLTHRYYRLNDLLVGGRLQQGTNEILAWLLFYRSQEKMPL